LQNPGQEGILNLLRACAAIQIKVLQGVLVMTFYVSSNAHVK